MKANEAPEKIYIQTNAHDGWFETAPDSSMFVEYTRTDAFIEKAEKYIRSVADGLDRDDDVEAFISEFRKYMKGEQCLEEEIKKLHRMTGLGTSECRKAYEKFGNFNDSYKYLREKWRGVWTTADK